MCNFITQLATIKRCSTDKYELFSLSPNYTDFNWTHASFRGQMIENYVQTRLNASLTTWNYDDKHTKHPHTRTITHISATQHTHGREMIRGESEWSKFIAMHRTHISRLIYLLATFHALLCSRTMQCTVAIDVVVGVVAFFCYFNHKSHLDLNKNIQNRNCVVHFGVCSDVLVADCCNCCCWLFFLSILSSLLFSCQAVSISLPLLNDSFAIFVRDSVCFVLLVFSDNRLRFQVNKSYDRVRKVDVYKYEHAVGLIDSFKSHLSCQLFLKWLWAIQRVQSLRLYHLMLDFVFFSFILDNMPERFSTLV